MTVEDVDPRVPSAYKPAVDQMRLNGYVKGLLTQVENLQNQNDMLVRAKDSAEGEVRRLMDVVTALHDPTCSHPGFKKRRGPHCAICGRVPEEIDEATS